MADHEPLRLSLKLDGPLVEENRLPLSELARVARQVRIVLRDVAIVMSKQTPSGGGGRVERFIEQATDLQVVGSPKAGSFVLELETPTVSSPGEEELPGDFGPGLPEQVVETFLEGLAALDAEARELPDGFDGGVLRAISPLGTALDKGLTRIQLVASNGSGPPRKAAIDRSKVEAAKTLIKRPFRARASAEGVLLMVDFAHLKCRIDRPPHPSVECIFAERDREVVHSAVRQYVRVVGDGEFEPGAKEPKRIHADAIDVVYEELPFDPEAFWQRTELADLVATVPAFRSPKRSQVSEDPWRDDEEAAGFLAAIEEA